MSEDEKLLKICIIGQPSELKAKLVRRFAEGEYLTDYLPPGGVDITTKKIIIDNHQVKLILVDIAGEEFYRKIRPSCYRGASAGLILFDKSDRDSFKAAKDSYKEFRKYIPDVSIPIALVGIITNSEHVNSQEGLKFAKKHKMCYYEWQPTMPELVETIFLDLTRQVLGMKNREV